MKEEGRRGRGIVLKTKTGSAGSMGNYGVFDTCRETLRGREMLPASPAWPLRTLYFKKCSGFGSQGRDAGSVLGTVEGHV